MKLPIVSHQAHERKLHDGRIWKPKPQQVGVQISRCVHSQVPEKDPVRGAETASRRGLPQACTAKGKPSRRRPSHAGSRSHDDLDSTKIRGLAGGRIYQGQECDPFGPCLWGEEAQLCRAALLGQRYFVSTVGRDEAVIREYIKRQEQEDNRLEQMNLWR